MNKTLILGVALLFVAACVPSSASGPTYGNGLHDVNKFTIDGTTCIMAQRYSSVALSCNWNNQ